MHAAIRNLGLCVLTAMVVIGFFTQLHIAYAQQEPIPLPPPPDGNNTLGSSGSLQNNNTWSNPNLIEAPQTQACTHQSPIQLAWFYKPSSNWSVEGLSRKFSTFVLTRHDEDELEELQDYGEYPILQYIKFDAIHDPCQQAKKAQGTPCSCGTQPRNNQVAWEAGDVCWIRDNHSDWFLRDSDGDLMYFNGYVMMDPGRAGWRNFWLQRIQISQADGWDGVFIDNMTTRFGQHTDNLTDLIRYPDVAAYQAAVINFLAQVQAQWFIPNGKRIYANVSVRWGDTSVYLNYLDQLNGAQDEFWAVPRDGWYSLRSWEDRLIRMGETVNRGKTAILVSLGDKNNTTRQNFALASYLLIASPNTFFRYSHQDYYQNVWMYDNYNLKLGEPTGPYARVNDRWERNFTNGRVVVRPESHTATITVNDTNC